MVVGVLLVQALVLAQGQLELLVEILENDLVENRVRFVLQNVEVASQRDQIGLELGDDVLPGAPGAHAVAGAVDAVPVLVFDHIIDVLIVVRPKAKGAEFSLALVVNGFIILLRVALKVRVGAWHPKVQGWIEIRENNPRISQ